MMRTTSVIKDHPALPNPALTSFMRRGLANDTRAPEHAGDVSKGCGRRNGIPQKAYG